MIFLISKVGVALAAPVNGNSIQNFFLGNSFNKPAYWLDGSFYSGDFQNGMWYNGIFGVNNSYINKNLVEFNQTNISLVELELVDVSKFHVQLDGVPVHWEDFKKLLQQPSRPTHFECEIDTARVPDGDDGWVTIEIGINITTNSQGQVELVGKYVY